MVYCQVCGCPLDGDSPIKRFDFFLGVTSCCFCIQKRVREFEEEMEREAQLKIEEYSKQQIVRRGRPKEVINPVNIRSACNWFVTVSAKEHDTNGVGLWKRACKMMNRYQADYKGYTIEQKSENPDNVYGFHIHFLLRHPKEVFKAQLIQKFSFAFNDFIVGHNSIDVRPENVSHVQYIQGTKREEKMGKVEVDKIWKQKNNIPMYIEQ